MEEPTIIKRFDGNNIVNQNFDMEHRLFSLIDELTYVVNHFKRLAMKDIKEITPSFTKVFIPNLR